MKSLRFNFPIFALLTIWVGTADGGFIHPPSGRLNVVYPPDINIMGIRTDYSYVDPDDPNIELDPATDPNGVRMLRLRGHTVSIIEPGKPKTYITQSNGFRLNALIDQNGNFTGGDYEVYETGNVLALKGFLTEISTVAFFNTSAGQLDFVGTVRKGDSRSSLYGEYAGFKVSLLQTSGVTDFTTLFDLSLVSQANIGRPVPEPNSLAIACGLLSFGAMRRKRKRRFVCSLN